MVSQADSRSVGIARVRAKSLAVPRGRRPRVASWWAKESTEEETEPSPPPIMIGSCPSEAAWRTVSARRAGSERAWLAPTSKPRLPKWSSAFWKAASPVRDRAFTMSAAPCIGVTLARSRGVLIRQSCACMFVAEDMDPREEEHHDETARAAVRRGERTPEGQGRPGRLEHPRPGEGVAGVHAGLEVAQPRRVLRGARGDRRVPEAQVGARAGLPAREEPVVLHAEPDRGQVRVREPGRERPVVAFPR